MVRLLYCIPLLYQNGGTERIVIQKINYLLDFPDKKFEVTILTTEGINKNSFYHLHPDAKIVELNINFLEEFQKPLVQKFIGTKRKLKEYKNRLKQIVEQHKIDICISTGAKELEFLSTFQLPCKKICELHFSKNSRKLFLKNKRGIIWKFLGEIRTKQLIEQTQKLDKLIVLTKQDKNDWEKTNSNVMQIYNFTDFQPKEISNLKNHRVISVGRLTHQKGYNYLIDAWKIVHKKQKNWILDIYGEGDLYEELSLQIQRNNLQNTIFLRGSTNEIEKHLVESSVFALSSNYEGFPMVLLESMAYGVPLVSFDCETGPSEIIENNDCGILVEDKNIEQLGEALIGMIENENLRKQKGKNAKQKSDRFSKDQIMKQWMELFDELMSNKN